MSELHSVPRDGAIVSYRREGHGTPCLVIGSDVYYRRALPQTLKQHFELIYCNVRHWVPSTDASADDAITLQTYADDIDAIRRHAGVDRTIVLGQSIHGTLALEYARYYPGQVRGVIAVAAPPVGLTELGQRAFALWEPDASEARKAAHESNLRSRRAPAVNETPQDVVDGYLSIGAMCWYDPTFDATPLWDGVEANVSVFNKLYLELFRDYVMPALHIPVLLVLGRYDYVVPYTCWKEPMERLSELRHVLYECSGHAPQFEEPDRFVDDVTDWTRTLRP